MIPITSHHLFNMSVLCKAHRAQFNIPAHLGLWFQNIHYKMAADWWSRCYKMVEHGC